MKQLLAIFSFILSALIPRFVSAQESILDSYISEALRSNLVIQQRNISLDNALTALKQAKYLYIPTIDFQMLYTTARGGRQIDLPVGDMMNPVYSTLNQFIGQNVFPMIENQTINFLPKNYYDARVRLAVPILNTDIIHNQRIQEKSKAIQENEVEIYQRELIKEIKSTYFNYLSVLKATEVKQNMLSLALEGKRTNEKLVEAGKGLPAYVLRSETEIVQIESDIVSLQAQQKTLLQYFNALLNREENASIEVHTGTQIIPFSIEFTKEASKREELESLDFAITLREDIVRMKQQSFVPKLNGFADLGSQAEQMRFNDKSVYYMVGLQLSIPIFNGLKTSMQIKEAKNNVEIAKLQRQYIEQQLDVSISKAYNEALAAQKRYESSLKQLEMAETYHRLIDKGFSAGVNTFIETVDARTQLSNAQLNTNLQYYQLLIALANLERETASYPLPQ